MRVSFRHNSPTLANVLRVHAERGDQEPDTAALLRLAADEIDALTDLLDGGASLIVEDVARHEETSDG